MQKKSVRVTTGKGGRPKGNGVRHSSGNVKTEPEAHELQEVEIEKEEDDIRESIREALLENTKNIKVWLEQIGMQDPLKALTLYKDLAEFIVPKMQRTDSKIDPSAPLQLHLETIDNFKKRQEDKETEKKIKEESNGFPKLNR